jgi:hypothetical protein
MNRALAAAAMLTQQFAQQQVCSIIVCSFCFKSYQYCKLCHPYYCQNIQAAQQLGRNIGATPPAAHMNTLMQQQPTVIQTPPQAHQVALCLLSQSLIYCLHQLFIKNVFSRNRLVPSIYLAIKQRHHQHRQYKMCLQLNHKMHQLPKPILLHGKCRPNWHCVNNWKRHYWQFQRHQHRRLN